MGKYLLFALLLIATPASSQGEECKPYFDEQLNQMGIIVRVDITKTGVLSCGHWELDGKPAKVPYADLPSATYCRKLVDNKTFFAYRWSGMMDCSQVGDRLKFIVEY